MIQVFNVLWLNFSTKKVEYYDVLPYFRDCWKDKCYKNEIEAIKSFDQLKDWIIGKSRYMYRARCQYEFLIASWPFGGKRLKDDMKLLLASEFNIDDYDQCLKFENIIIKDMTKIDIHYQIMMNIDIVVNLLNNEFHVY
jgi:hypothetical protein